MSNIFAVSQSDGLRIIAGDNVWMATMEADGLTLRRIEPEGMSITMSEVKAEYTAGESEVAEDDGNHIYADFTRHVESVLICENCKSELGNRGWLQVTPSLPKSNFVTINDVEVVGLAVIRCPWCGRVNIFESDESAEDDGDE